MHLIFLVNDIHFGGGGERVAIQQANYFNKQQYTVSILSVQSSKSSILFPVDPGVELKYLNVSAGNNLISKIISVIRIRNYFKNLCYPVIAFGIGNYPSVLLGLIQKNKNITTIGCQHNSFSAVKGIWQLIRKIGYPRLNAIISLTEADKLPLSKLNRNAFVIPNASSVQPAVSAELRNKIILTIGRLDYNKGIDLLIHVFEKVALIAPDWKLRIVGDGPEKMKLMKLVREKKLDHKITFIEATQNVECEYLNASVFALTSRSEGMPMVLLEAQSYGLPIVSFNCETGPADIINHGEDGFLIDNFDVSLMAERVSELCNSYEKRLEFGCAARQNIKKFSPEIIFKKWEALFRQLIPISAN